MDPTEELLLHQDGVIARHQALQAGWSPTAIKRKIRRREWTPVHPGVYVNHTGPLTWPQRAWAAVLVCWPAALDGWSALRAHEGPGRRGAEDSDPIRVLVGNDRRISGPEGVVPRRSRRFAEAVQWNLSPPRMRYDDTILDLADTAAGDVAAVAVLADACGGRRTTAERLRARMDALPRMHRRDWLAGVLADVAAGTCSVLEHGYLTLVERPHGLPRGLRQAAAADTRGRRMFRDVVYGGRHPRWRQIVELDGRLHHDSAAARDRDLERDLDAAFQQEDTVRLGYGQVFDRPCSTAVKLAALLGSRGWRGRPHPCPNCRERGDCGVAGQPA